MKNVLVLLPILLYVAIGLLVHRNLGHYNHSILPLTLGFLIALFAMFRYRMRLEHRVWSIVLATVLPLFLTRIAKKRLILSAIPDHWASDVFNQLIAVSIALSVVLVLFFALPRARELWVRVCAGLLGFLLLAAQLLVPILSPATRIDVFVNNTAAARYFLRGLNPYPQAYENLYPGMYDYVPGFLYFPGTVLYQAPFLALFGDIRYGFVLANLVIAAGLLWLARRRASDSRAYLFPLLWLSFPVTYFVLEQAWTDTVLVMLAVLSFILIELRRFAWAGALLGFAFAYKQYGFVITGVGLAQILAVGGFRVAFKAALSAGAVFAAAVLPFAWADWESFYKFTIANQVQPGLRKDAYNFTVFLFNRWGITLPKGIGSLLSLSAILGGMFWAWRGSPRGGLGPAALGVFLAYGIAFFFGKWAFCNYYYLLVSFLLLYLLSLLTHSVTDREEIQA